VSMARMINEEAEIGEDGEEAEDGVGDEAVNADDVGSEDADIGTADTQSSDETEK